MIFLTNIRCAFVRDRARASIKKQPSSKDRPTAELRLKVKCPVCLLVARDGQMLARAREHLVCGMCGVEMTKEGKEECQMCRELKSKSLLAKNLKHDCTKGAS